MLGFAAAWLLAVAAIVAIAAGIDRRAEAFLVSLRGGRLLLVRGALPPGLLVDLAEALADGPETRATLRVALASGGVSLRARGLDAARTQRVRNLLGLLPPSRLRRPRGARPLYRRLGVVWLAWWLGAGDALDVGDIVAAERARTQRPRA